MLNGAITYKINQYKKLKNMKKYIANCLVGSFLSAVIIGAIVGVFFFNKTGSPDWIIPGIAAGVAFVASLITLGLTLPGILKGLDRSTFTVKNEMNFTDLISKGTKLVLAGVIPSEGLKVQEKVLFRIEGKDNNLFFFRSPDTFTLAGVQPGARFRLEMKPKGGYTAHIEGEE
jgi:hypothetical protein